MQALRKDAHMSDKVIYLQRKRMKGNSLFLERKGKNGNAPLPAESHMYFRNVFCTFSKM